MFQMPIRGSMRPSSFSWRREDVAHAETQFEVVSFRSASPEIYREHFDDGYYCENADNKWTFVFDIKPVLVQAMGQPIADDGAATSPTLRVHAATRARTRSCGCRR